MYKHKANQENNPNFSLKSSQFSSGILVSKLRLNKK